MSRPVSSLFSGSITRVRFVLENFRPDFCPLLIKRLFPVIRWNIPSSGKFLPIINIIDRTDETAIDNKVLVYAGITILNQLPMFSDLDPEGKDQKVKSAIKALDDYRITTETSVETKKFFEEFESGELAMKDIKVTPLTEYFASYLIHQGYNPEQEHEYTLIDRFFTIDTASVISLPLIQFGNFDGLVHIVFEDNDKGVLEDESIQRRLIRLFSMEYEGLLLDWDLVGGNIEKKSKLPDQLAYLSSDEYVNDANTNPIIRELGYREYYLDSMPYFKDRIKYNDNVPDYLKNEYRKRAIISILIDSYAHNISAHSLTVIKWWFQQRATNTGNTGALKKIEEEIIKADSYETWGSSLRDYLEGRLDGYAAEDIEKGILRDLARWINIADRTNETYLPVRDQFLPSADQLHPLFRFLLEKGAFWSGITRDLQFGGEIIDLYDVLWNDFINNPLYLGTIAYSEGITKLNINLRFYAEADFIPERSNDFERTYNIESDAETGALLTGRFATINVGGGNEKTFTHHYLQYGPEEHEAHERLAKKLKQCDVFLPGGVVGKHALFTLIENEIRNVKHYPEHDLKTMRDQGLDLFISIRPGALSLGEGKIVNVTEKQLHKIGVWIGTPTRLRQSDQHLVTKRLGLLMQDIITEDTNRARLGGNYQDKICAAMLFNNTFLSVEPDKYKKTDRDQNYYPWLRVAYSGGLTDNGRMETDYEVRARNLELAREQFENRELHGDKGYFKKYFHLWQGKHIFRLRSKQDLHIENMARFKMVATKKAAWEDEVRAQGVIRVISEKDKELTWGQGYHSWLQRWLKETPRRITLVRGVTSVGHLVFDREVIQYYSQDQFMDELTEDQLQDYADYPSFELRFAHGEEVKSDEPVLSVRNHGVLKQHFFDDLKSINGFDTASISAAHAYELLEVIMTKVCIFDKRIAERVGDPKKRQYLNDQMRCGIYWEDADKWEEVKAEGLHNYHFIIMHLSFIEALIGKNGKRYGEEGIIDFLEEQVGNQLSENCIFVVTTGRGREEWWRKIEDSRYRLYSTFRPVETLIEAVETARLLEDDINLKYNLVKVLFGS